MRDRFTLSITCIGAVRELIGAGSIFGKQILPLADAAAGIVAIGFAVKEIRAMDKIA